MGLGQAFERVGRGGWRVGRFLHGGWGKPLASSWNLTKVLSGAPILTMTVDCELQTSIALALAFVSDPIRPGDRLQ